jgi:hypothetical protein
LPGPMRRRGRMAAGQRHCHWYAGFVLTRGSPRYPHRPEDSSRASGHRGH